MPKKRSGFCGFVSGKIQINLLSQGVGAPVRRDVRVEVGPCDADHDRELGVDAMLVHLDAGLLECPGNGEIAVNGAKHAILGKVAVTAPSGVHGPTPDSCIYNSATRYLAKLSSFLFRTTTIYLS